MLIVCFAKLHPGREDEQDRDSSCEAPAEPWRLHQMIIVAYGCECIICIRVSKPQSIRISTEDLRLVGVHLYAESCVVEPVVGTANSASGRGNVIVPFEARTVVDDP